MKRSIIYWFGVVIGLLMIACSSDNDNEPTTTTPDPDNGMATLVFTLPSSATRADSDDNEITTFRVMVFRTGTANNLAYNEVFDMTSATSPVKVNLKVGTYDFLFIANEYVDAALEADLNAYYGQDKTLSGLEGKYFTSGSFDSAKDIPMVGLVRNAELISDNKVKVAGYTSTGAWNISTYLKRLGVRIDFTMKATSYEFGNNFQKLQIANVPTKVFLFERTTGSTPAAIYNNDGVYENPVREITVFDAGSGYNSTTGQWVWKKERLILPSNTFSALTTSANATRFEALMSDRSPLSTTLGYNEPSDYTLPRNKYFKLIGVLSDRIDFSVVVEQWNAEAIVDLK